MAERTKIGILDSGVGGLSVLREIRALRPDLEIHYIGDSAWCPYGNKSPEAICERVTVLTDDLLARGVEMVVIACNSATIHAVEFLRASYPIPFVGMEPAVKPAAHSTKKGIVGVLATEASIAGDKFHRLVDQHADGVRLITQPCPRFVELVEEGVLSGSRVEDAINEVVQPLLKAGADVLVLGCTHYPFLRAAIESCVPGSIEIIDTGPAVARRVASLLTDQPEVGDGPISIETTGDLAHLRELLPKLLPVLAREAALSKSAW